MALEWKTCIRVAVTVMSLYLATRYWDAVINFFVLAIGAAFPLLLGCGIAYVANILMSFFERHFMPRAKNNIIKTIRRPICILLTFASIVLVVFLIVSMILPELTACVQILIESIISIFNKLASWVGSNVSSDIIPSESLKFFQNSGNINWQEMIGKAIDFLMTGVGGAMTSLMGIFTSVFSAMISFIVALIFSIYVLMGKENIGEQCKKFMKIYFGNNTKNKIMYIVESLDCSFHKFIVGQCIEAVILGILCTLGMLIFRLPYATMIGCLVGFSALIPMVGAWIGAAIGAFMIFTVSPVQAIIFLIFLVVLQQLEGNLIYPRVVGSSIGLPGIWVLVAVTVGGGALGIGGMLIGVPLAAALYKMLKVDMQNREKTTKI